MNSSLPPRLLLPILLLALISCRKQEEPKNIPKLAPPGQIERSEAEYPPGYVSQLEKFRKWKVEAFKPAPADYQPKVSGKKIELKLALEKSLLAPGENVWYRVEMQNVGNQDILWSEEDYSFFLQTSLPTDHFEALLKRPGHPFESLITQKFFDTFPQRSEDTSFRFPKNWSEKQKSAAFKRMVAESKSAFKFEVVLKPGDSLVTRPAKHLSPHERLWLKEAGKDPDAPLDKPYRELTVVMRDFNGFTVGRHALKFKFRGIGPTRTLEDQIAHNQREYGNTPQETRAMYLDWMERAVPSAESNVVHFEVRK